MRVVDAHLHLWRPQRHRYSWLSDPALSAIARPFGREDALAAIAGTPVTDVVLVQAENSIADTDDMLEVTADWDAVAGIVAWVPVEDQRTLEEHLTRYSSNPLVVGCRHLNHVEPDPGWLSRASVLSGLRSLSRHGLTFDVVAVTERHLHDAASIAGCLPDLTIVVDHLGSPNIAAAGWEPWATALLRVASHPNTVVKVSGLSTLAGPEHRKERIGPYLEHARQLFGANRMMFGGDWPVCTLAVGYRAVWDVINSCLAEWPEVERQEILGGTARRIYRLAGRSSREGGACGSR